MEGDATGDDALTMLSAAEAAALLGVSRHTVYRMVERGELRPAPFTSVLRIPIVELRRHPRAGDDRETSGPAGPGRCAWLPSRTTPKDEAPPSP